MIEAKPLTEAECQQANLIPVGVFPFKVIFTMQKHSEKMGEFFSLKMNVFVGDKSRVIFDSLFFTENMMWKVRHFYRSINQMDIYESGKFQPADCDFKEGLVSVGQRIKKDTGELESYVKDYVAPEPKAFPDDELPDII